MRVANLRTPPFPPQIGNKMMLVGPGVPIPPAEVLTADSAQIYLQGVDPASGNYTGGESESSGCFCEEMRGDYSFIRFLWALL